MKTVTFEEFIKTCNNKQLDWYFATKESICKAYPDDHDLQIVFSDAIVTYKNGVTTNIIPINN